MLTLLRKETGWLVALLVAGLFVAPTAAEADVYIGGSVGQAGVELEDDSISSISFDEDDFAWKAFIGYEFPVPVVNLAIEGGYVDLGAPSGDVLAETVEVDADGLSAFGILGIDLGPLGVFAKYGVISWDATLTIDGLGSESDDGSDPAYGIGAKFGLGPVDVRAEYEIFDIEDTEDVSMISVGITWSF